MTTPVHSVDMDDAILKVKRLFDHVRCHHVVVLKNHRVHGVVSDRDMLHAVSPFVGSKLMERAQDVNTLKKRVHQVMSRNLITTVPEETVADAAQKMLVERVSCLPVVDGDGAPVGIVTVRDVVGWAVAHAGTNEGRPARTGCDGGVLIIVDGVRCYSPDAEIGQLIRNADKHVVEQDGTEPAGIRRLSKPIPQPVGS